MNPDLDTLATALYVRLDDLLVAHPGWVPPRPAVGIVPKLADSELATLAVLQALLGFASEARFVRYAKTHLRAWFPYVPERAGYNKRLRRSGELMAHVLRALTRDCPSRHDDVSLVDSTPVECGRSRETQKRSDLADGAPTATAPRTPGTSGACTCSQPRRVCPSPSPTRKPTNATRAWT